MQTGDNNNGDNNNNDEDNNNGNGDHTYNNTQITQWWC